MKKYQNIRSALTLVVIAFAVIQTGCNKTELIPPDSNNAGVSKKPALIITTKNGTEITREIYQYRLNNLSLYIRLSIGETDSLKLMGDSIQYRRIFPSFKFTEMLLLNDNKTFQKHRTGTGAGTELLFQNRVFELNRVIDHNQALGSDLMMSFQYDNHRISSYSRYNSNTEITYYDDLPYQKGINEFSHANTPLLIHKILEQENATSMKLYDKLFREIETNDGPFGKRISYSYEFDEHQRVKTIQMDIVHWEGTTQFSNRETKTIEYADTDS